MRKEDILIAFVTTLIVATGIFLYKLNLDHERDMLLNKDLVKLEEYRLVTERERVINEGVYLRALELNCAQELTTRDGEHYKRQWDVS